MTTHTGEVLYSCPHCPRTFNSNANMHSHRKKMHLKEWQENRKHRKGKVAEIPNIVAPTQSVDISPITNVDTNSLHSLNEDIILSKFDIKGEAVYHTANQNS